MPLRKELQAITDLEAGARVVPVGSDLYRQGDICSTYYMVLNGWIALSMLLDDGSCQILDFALPGAVLGFQSRPGAAMYHSARCLSVVRVYAFPRRELEAIIESNPRLAILLCGQITADEARAHDHLTNLGLRGARERIARFLLELYVRVRRRLPAEPGEVIQLPLSQTHIGQALGLTYVHVCRTLQILRKQKIVRFANHRFEIIDPQALVGASGIDVDMLYYEHRAPSRELARVRSPADQDVPSSLPAGWIPMEDNTTSRTPVAQRQAA
jgi:CRP/FNR family transcriptional regulator, anaerobic regulatory protein